MRKKILEIGCGQGFNTYCLSKHNDVIGIDISKEDIAISKKRYPDVDYRVMDMEGLQFKDDYFDEVYAMDTLEHIDNFDRVIGEIKRVLKSSGKFIVNIPYWKSEYFLLKIRPTYFEEIHHVKIFGKGELENLLSKKGFRLIKKARTGFLNHIFQYYMFKRKIRNKSQLGIGNWRDNWKTKSLFIVLMLFDAQLFKTPLKYFPIWILTFPIGLIIGCIGNIFFPKSLFYIFKNEK